MAGPCLRLSRMIMNDNWPGVPNPNMSIPTGGFDATEWNFTTSDDTAKADNPPFAPGTKISVYTDNSECPGYYTMMYLARHEFSSECISSDFSEAVIFCAPVGAACQTHTAIASSDDSESPPYYIVTQCYTAGTVFLTCASMGAPLAIACTTTDADSSIALTTDPRANGYGHSWQWFWVGGVCPCKDITLLKGLGDSLLGADITVHLVERGSLYACATAGTGGWMPGHDLTEANDTTDYIQSGTCQVPFAWACSSG